MLENYIIVLEIANSETKFVTNVLSSRFTQNELTTGYIKNENSTKRTAILKC